MTENPYQSPGCRPEWDDDGDRKWLFACACAALSIPFGPPAAAWMYWCFTNNQVRQENEAIFLMLVGLWQIMIVGVGLWFVLYGDGAEWLNQMRQAIGK